MNQQQAQILDTQAQNIIACGVEEGDEGQKTPYLGTHRNSDKAGAFSNLPILQAQNKEIKETQENETGVRKITRLMSFQMSDVVTPREDEEDEARSVSLTNRSDRNTARALLTERSKSAITGKEFSPLPNIKNNEDKSPQNLMNNIKIKQSIKLPKINLKKKRQFDPFMMYKNAMTDNERAQIHLNYISTHTPAGEQVKQKHWFMYRNRDEELKDPKNFPATYLDNKDLKKRIGFKGLKNLNIEQLQLWKSKDHIGKKQGPYINQIQKKNEKILTVVEKDSLEKLEIYKDRFPLLKLRKSILKFIILIKMVAHAIISTQVFDNISIMVILLNSMVMMVEDPADKQPPDIYLLLDNIFLTLYSVEMVLKILGLNFIFGQHAYLKDPWNILDFVIVTSGYLTLLTDQNQGGSPKAGQEKGLDLSGLRVFRVMRPLKTISTIKGLKVLMKALFSAIPLLGDTIIILMFFFLIFAIAGTQLLAGNLKNRCIAIQTGIMHPDDLICHGDMCPGGYFCGKTNENPNFGVTSFDNILYSVLIVFQSVTLEGWSEIQRDMQKAYTYAIFLYFLPLVFIGAFFLLNLTLAVINAEFTKAHHEQQQRDLELQNLGNNKKMVSDQDAAMNLKDDVSFSAFMTAKKCAKIMVQNLRIIQERKRLEEEERERQALIRIQQQKEEQERKKKEKEQKLAEQSLSNLRSKDFIEKQTKKKAVQISPVKEVEEDVEDEPQVVLKKQSKNKVMPMDGPMQLSEQDMIQRDIQEFLKKVEVEQIDQEFFTAQATERMRNIKKGRRLEKKLSIMTPTEGGLKMKGNLGLKTRKAWVEDESSEKTQIQSQKKTIIDPEDLDIEKVLGSGKGKLDEAVSIGFDKSSMLEGFNPQDSMFLDGQNLQALETARNTRSQQEEQAEKISIQISSASDVEKDFDISGYIAEDNKKQTQNQPRRVFKNFKDFLTNSMVREEYNINNVEIPDYNRNDVSKIFKKMLANQRGQLGRSTVIQDTKNDLIRQIAGQNGKPQICNLDIEKKYSKVKNPSIFDSVDFKKEAGIAQKRTPNQSPGPKPIVSLSQLIKKDKKAYNKDPFHYLDPMNQKVTISKNTKYQGTSENDVFQLRLIKEQAESTMKANHFLKLPDPDSVDPNKGGEYRIRPNFEAYQQKVIYQVYPDTSDIDGSSDDEDHLCATEQPYKTPTNVGYNEEMKSTGIYELARRSDIMVTSTLAMSLFPSDRRIIAQIDKSMMTPQQRNEFIDEKNAFNALCKEHTYKCKRLRDKDKEYRDTYLKSFISSMNFKSKALRKFKQNVSSLNKNNKEKPPQDPEIVKAEKMRHQQNIRATMKKPKPLLTMDIANRLLAGTYHDHEEDEADQNEQALVVKVNTEEDLKQNIMNFQNELQAIIDDDSDKKVNDHIPKQLREQFKIPENLGNYEIDFDAIRKNDASHKKQKPLWSGQDVLPDHLNFEKSAKVADSLSNNRVWPVGIKGWIKRVRFLLRVLVKSAFFDNSMTFAVLLNTIVLSISHHGIEPDLEEILTMFNDWFTWIFIFEMGCKLLALGVSKYCGDRMNFLDGTVVIISIFELIYTASADGQIDLKSFATIRMFRTFRVFRIARLLRALESMQTILGVIQRSYKSFIYITLLMFVFIFIFSLLGMQIFGGMFNYPDGKPRGNYDTFPVAFVTVFQVLTMENWQSVLFDSMRGDLNKFIVAFFYIAWIFIGNFILLNLFLAILLDSFLEEEEEGEDDEERAQILKEKRKRAHLKKLRRQKGQVLMGKQNSVPSRLYFGQVQRRVRGRA